MGARGSAMGSARTSVMGVEVERGDDSRLGGGRRGSASKPQGNALRTVPAALPKEKSNLRILGLNALSVRDGDSRESEDEAPRTPRSREKDEGETKQEDAALSTPRPKRRNLLEPPPRPGGQKDHITGEGDNQFASPSARNMMKRAYVGPEDDRILSGGSGMELQPGSIYASPGIVSGQVSVHQQQPQGSDHSNPNPEYSFSTDVSGPTPPLSIQEVATLLDRDQKDLASQIWTARVRYPQEKLVWWPFGHEEGESESVYLEKEQIKKSLISECRVQLRQMHDKLNRFPALTQLTTTSKRSVNVLADVEASQKRNLVADKASKGASKGKGEIRGPESSSSTFVNDVEG
ncbi:unnamed protein product [Amoebophrya sp. A25]|nr:unnamed protein product [Amoebophrya sp. A25]|eukprot:GSA25T00018444001.1